MNEMNIGGYTPEELEEGRSAAILSYIPFVCLVPFIKWKDNRFVQAHARQGLALFVVELVVLFLLIPGLAALILKLILTAAIVLSIIGITFVLQEKDWRIPVIGDWIDDKLRENRHSDF